MLRDQLGPKLAKRAGVNFEAPIELPRRPLPSRRAATARCAGRAHRRAREPRPTARAQARLGAARRSARAVARPAQASPAPRPLTARAGGKVERLSLARPPEPTEPHAPRRGGRAMARRPRTFAGRRDGPARRVARTAPDRAVANLGDRRRGGAAPSRPPRADERKRFDEGARGERTRRDAPRPASESFGGRGPGRRAARTAPDRPPTKPAVAAAARLRPLGPRAQLTKALRRRRARRTVAQRRAEARARNCSAAGATAPAGRAGDTDEAGGRRRAGRRSPASARGPQRKRFGEGARGEGRRE